MLRVKQSYYFTEAHLKEMTFEDKRALLQNIFNGTDNDGKRFGVYVERKGKGSWLYTIKGMFIEEVGRLNSPTRNDKQNMRRKRNAYNRFRLHK